MWGYRDIRLHLAKPEFEKVIKRAPRFDLDKFKSKYVTWLLHLGALNMFCKYILCVSCTKLLIWRVFLWGKGSQKSTKVSLPSSRICEGVGESQHERLVEYKSLYERSPPEDWWGWSFFKNWWTICRRPMCSRQREKYKKEPPAVLLAGSKRYHMKIAASTSIVLSCTIWSYLVRSWSKQWRQPSKLLWISMMSLKCSGIWRKAGYCMQPLLKAYLNDLSIEPHLFNLPPGRGHRLANSTQLGSLTCFCLRIGSRMGTHGY